MSLGEEGHQTECAAEGPVHGVPSIRTGSMIGAVRDLGVPGVDVRAWEFWDSFDRFDLDHGDVAALISGEVLKIESLDRAFDLDPCAVR